MKSFALTLNNTVKPLSLAVSSALLVACGSTQTTTINQQNIIINQAFVTNENKNLINLGNRVSRKKQFVPILEGFYAKFLDNNR